jgi:hypothetical protein
VIAEEKIWMVEQSRRTILLISPEYLQEEWPRFEYVLAQQEMLRLRHRVIPVILRDISHVTDVDPVLKNMMKSLTCIVWPQEDDNRAVQKFWKRIELAMPKKSTKSGKPAKKKTRVLNHLQRLFRKKETVNRPASKMVTTTV